jgi:predicted AAA+ superfamily ATPase
MSLPTDGLPNKLSGLRSERTDTIKKITEHLEDFRSVLITAPPFSGKTCLSQLFHERFKASATYISFAGFHPIRDQNGLCMDDSYEKLDKYFVNETELTIEECVFREDHILITDETQNIYEIGQFWELFKKSKSKL